LAKSFKKPAIRWLLAPQEITYVQMATRLILGFGEQWNSKRR